MKMKTAIAQLFEVVFRIRYHERVRKCSSNGLKRPLRVSSLGNWTGPVRGNVYSNVRAGKQFVRVNLQWLPVTIALNFASDISKSRRNDDGRNAEFDECSDHFRNMSVDFDFVEIGMNFGNIAARPELDIPLTKLIVGASARQPVAHVCECHGVPHANSLVNISPGIGSAGQRPVQIK